MSAFDADQLPDGASEGAPRSLRGKFLLASASLVDHRFSRTVILVLRHDVEGAVGLVVNRPIGMSLDEACGGEVDAARGLNTPLFLGGPCKGPLMAIHNDAILAEAEAEADAFEDPFSENPSEENASLSAEAVVPGVWFSTRRETLEALMQRVREVEENGTAAEPHSPVGVKFIAQYAGWGPGQLEGELAEGAWLVADSSTADIYAGGSPDFPPPAPSTSLPPGAIGVVGVLAQVLEGHDPIPGLAAGIRQWVRLSTRVNLLQMVDERLIPPDPSAN